MMTLGPFGNSTKHCMLHLSLLESRRDKLAVARRRLLPGNLPPPARATESKSRHAVYAAWFVSRLRHHLLSLASIVASGWRWWRRMRSC